jgi:hypothetical protein
MWLTIFMRHFEQLAATMYRKSLLCVPSLGTVFKKAWPPERCRLTAALFAFHCPHESGLLWVNKVSHFAGSVLMEVQELVSHRILRACLLFADCSTLGRVKGRCQRSWQWYRSRNLRQLQLCCAWCVSFSCQLWKLMTPFSHVCCQTCHSFSPWMWSLMFPASFADSSQVFSIAWHFRIKLKYKNRYACNGLCKEYKQYTEIL